MKHFKFPRIVALLSLVFLSGIGAFAQTPPETLVFDRNSINESAPYDFKIEISNIKVEYEIVPLEKVWDEMYCKAPGTISFHIEFTGEYESISFMAREGNHDRLRSLGAAGFKVVDGVLSADYVCTVPDIRLRLYPRVSYTRENGWIRTFQNYNCYFYLRDYTRPEDYYDLLFENERTTTGIKSSINEDCEASEYLVYNPQGALVRTVSNAGEIRSGLAPGVYVVVIRQANGIVSTEKMIVR